MKKWYSSIGILFLVFSGAQAQQRSRADTTERRYAADTLRVTAAHVYSAASDAEFRAADFALRPRTSAQDMLRVVPGLVIAQHAGGGKAEQIFLRGFDCDHGTDVNISVDDAPVNMVSHGHGQGYADLHFIIPETIDRIDVVKGPYFARYGDLATAGAVVFSTADSLPDNLLKFETDPFLNQAYRAVALLRAPLGIPDLGAYVGGEVFSSRGYFDAPQDFRRVNLFAKARTVLASGGAITAELLSFNARWNASGQVPERAVDEGLISRFGSIDSTEGGMTSRTTAILKYSSGGSSPFTITGSFTDYQFRLYSNFSFFAVDSIRGDEIEQTDSRSILSIKADKDMFYDIVSIPMRTHIGLGLRGDDIRTALHHDSARVRLERKVDAAIRERQEGPYLEQEIILPWAQFLFGLRADYFSFDVENRLTSGSLPDGVIRKFLVSPKANMSIPINDRAVLFVNTGFGFHSNDARVVVSAHGDSVLPRAFGAEAGFRYGKPNDIISGSAAFWLLDLESEFVWSGDEGAAEPDPNGKTQRTGVDIEARLNPSDWLTVGADATLSRGRFVDLPDGANYIPLAPDLTLTGNAVARFDPISAALRLRLVGDRPAIEDNSVRAKGYAIIDLSAACRFEHVEIFVNVENLLNTAWNEAQFDTESRLRGEAAAVSELHFTAGTPRAIRSGVAVRF